MEYDVYFDESGDLGWKLDQPYRKGGSSQFFTIAYLLIPKDKNKYINRFIRKFHHDRGGKEREYKGADFRLHRAKTIAHQIADLLAWNDDMILGAITVQKNHVPIRLTDSQNDSVLYDHMVQKALCDKLVDLKKATIIPDKRSVPRGSQNSCSDLLKGKLWLECGSEIVLEYLPEESHNNQRLIFIDWVANFVWRHYEDAKSDAYQRLQPVLQEERLFF